MHELENECHEIFDCVAIYAQNVQLMPHAFLPHQLPETLLVAGSVWEQEIEGFLERVHRMNVLLLLRHVRHDVDQHTREQVHDGQWHHEHVQQPDDVAAGRGSQQRGGEIDVEATH